MTIRFAAAHPEYNPVIARMMGVPARLRACNDNVLGLCTDRVLKAALRHFAKYGLGAAEQAKIFAEHAFFAGHSEDYRWWLSICRTLDKRMAEATAAHMGVPVEKKADVSAGNLA